MEENNKKSKTSLIIIILLVIVIIGLIGYIAYDKELIFNSNKEIHEKTNTNNQDQDSKTENDIIELSITEADKIFNSNTGYLKKEHLYPNTSFNIKDITDVEMFSILFAGADVNYCIYDNEGLQKSITIEEINEILDAYIPDHKKITIEDLKVNDAPVLLTMADYQYSDNYGIKVYNDKIYLIGSCGSEGNIFGNVETAKTIKATKVDDIITIYKKVAFGKANSDTVSEGFFVHYDYYNNYKMNGQIIESLDITEEEFSNLDEYNINYDKYNTYKYTFKIQNDIYQLESVEVEK